MPTISTPPFPARLQDNTVIHVIGIDLDSLPPKFIIMRPAENGSIRPDVVLEVFGVSLDDDEEAPDNG